MVVEFACEKCRLKDIEIENLKSKINEMDSENRSLKEEVELLREEKK